MNKIISKKDVERRQALVALIGGLGGDFINDFSTVEADLKKSIRDDGASELLAHLRLSGDIPEEYNHDSSQEKLYSKYTDALLAEAYSFIGLRSLVITERADVADVEAYAQDYSFVADAKAFRLSRTAKNQKDFKVTAMDRWKHGKPYAMIVCPIYQLPQRNSQIYEQATSRNVCIFTYSHLALCVRIHQVIGSEAMASLIHNLFRTIESLNPSKDASSYWLHINNVLLQSCDEARDLWRNEKMAAVESIGIAQELAIRHLMRQRENIMLLSHDEALKELVRSSKIEAKIKTIKSVTSNSILDMVDNKYL